MPILEAIGFVANVTLMIDRNPKALLEFSYQLHGPPIR